MNRKSLRACLIVCLIGIAIVARADTTDGLTSVKDFDVQTGMSDFSAAEKKAKDAYVRDIGLARTKLITSLTRAQATLTKSNNLDDAAKVRDAVTKLKEENVTTPRADEGKIPPGMLARLRLTQRLHKTKWRNGDGGTVTFDAETMGTTQSWHANPGTWSPITGNTLRASTSMNNCKAMVCRISDDGKQLIDEDGKTWMTRVD